MGVYEVLFNPLAGNGQGETEAKTLTARMPEDTLHFHSMTEIADYRAFFEAIPADHRVILCGGDGTLNRFINDTEGLSVLQEIWYFAAGSGNDFLRDTEREKGCLPFPVGQYLQELPTVTVAGKAYRFLNGIGYGIDGYCCEVGDAQRLKSDKPVNYAGIAVKGLLFHYRPTRATVIVDGEEHTFDKVWLAPTMNGRFYGGGMIPTPRQDRLAKPHRLSVMVMHGSGKLRTLCVFPSIFKGEHVKHTDMVTVLEGRDITVRFDRPTALQIDGETILGVTEYRAVAYAGKPACAAV